MEKSDLSREDRDIVAMLEHLSSHDLAELLALLAAAVDCQSHLLVEPQVKAA